MDRSNKIKQVLGLVCPFTGKIKFVEIAKDANIAYDNLLHAAELFTDPISKWIKNLKEKGVKPGCVILDTKTTDEFERKKYWEKKFGIINTGEIVNEKPENKKRNSSRQITNFKKY